MVFPRHFQVVTMVSGLLLCFSPPCRAGGGTAVVASPGQAVQIQDGWPQGVGKILNDATRTRGWNSWFTEWPNDVNQYALNVKSADDLNRLIRHLADVDSPLKRIRLSYLKEPGTIGMVSRAPVGNNIPVMFSLGNQKTVDEWYGRVRKPFGVIEFLETPVAVPPTLTIFVGHPVIRLQELKIPAGLPVEAGAVPIVFHRFNTQAERDRRKAATQAAAKANLAKQRKQLDATSRKTLDEINRFLKARQAGKADDTEQKD